MKEQMENSNDGLILLKIRKAHGKYNEEEQYQCSDRREKGSTNKEEYQMALKVEL